MANTNELDYSRKVADGERLELIMRQVASRFKLDGNVLAEALLDIHERLKAVEGATEELTSSDRWKAFKTVQLVKPSPSASGDTVTAIDTVAQDENGELKATKKNIRQGTTSQTGIVQLSDATNSTSTALAATANAVKTAYDIAASKQGTVSTDTDSSAFSDTTEIATGFGSDKIHFNVASRLWNYIKGKLGISSSGSSTKYLNEKGEWATVTTPDVSNKLDKDGLGDDVRVQFTQATTRTNIATGSKLSTLFGQIRKWFADLKALAFKNKVGTGDVESGTYPIGISGNAASADVASALDLNATVPIQAGTGLSITSSETAVTVALSESAQTSLGKADSALQNVKVNGNALPKTDNAVDVAVEGTYNASTNKIATVSSVTSRINALDAEVTSTEGTNVQVKVTEADGKVTAVNITKDDTEPAFSINYRASDHALVFSKAFGTIS